MTAETPDTCLIEFVGDVVVISLFTIGAAPILTAQLFRQAVSAAKLAIIAHGA
jgi:hypothetical protein